MSRKPPLPKEQEKLLQQINDVKVRKSYRKKLKNEHGCIRVHEITKLDGWEEQQKYHKNKLDKLIELIKEKPTDLPLGKFDDYL